MTKIDDVVDYLASFKTVKKMAAYCLRSGIVGVPNCDSRCVVVSLIQYQFPDLSESLIVVCPKRGELYLPQDGQMIECILPPVAEEFAFQFDLHKFPELEVPS